ncbi:hypothetical protein [Companilactobacillus ginsenosidimutans]|uniref:Uncharacterized protein n=1 Tax=Companilactobacillus ginsenosidimutans TaxID=1007676 RepID=A0A0H4R148_9LACO|nr:hypothetical protein [Companilactobacillus ginsenosidimutans]AKP67425.1 hypothetical protein ABM34_07685 [Companilactobacillus ginsenosidimutans]
MSELDDLLNDNNEKITYKGPPVTSILQNTIMFVYQFLDEESDNPPINTLPVKYIFQNGARRIDKKNTYYGDVRDDLAYQVMEDDIFTHRDFGDLVLLANGTHFYLMELSDHIVSPRIYAVNASNQIIDLGSRIDMAIPTEGEPGSSDNFYVQSFFMAEAELSKKKANPSGQLIDVDQFYKKTDIAFIENEKLSYEKIVHDKVYFFLYQYLDDEERDDGNTYTLNVNLIFPHTSEKASFETYKNFESFDMFSDGIHFYLLEKESAVKKVPSLYLLNKKGDVIDISDIPDSYFENKFDSEYMYDPMVSFFHAMEKKRLAMNIE